MPDEPADPSLAAAEAELARLDARRALLIARIVEQRRIDFPTVNGRRTTDGGPDRGIAAPVNNQSPQDTKVALFRSLFRGRPDIFPRRFESVKTGKSGYARLRKWSASAKTAHPLRSPTPGIGCDHSTPFDRR